MTPSFFIGCFEQHSKIKDFVQDMSKFESIIVRITMVTGDPKKSLKIYTDKPILMNPIDYTS